MSWSNHRENESRDEYLQSRMRRSDGDCTAGEGIHDINLNNIGWTLSFTLSTRRRGGRVVDRQRRQRVPSSLSQNELCHLAATK